MRVYKATYKDRDGKNRKSAIGNRQFYRHSLFEQESR